MFVSLSIFSSFFKSFLFFLLDCIFLTDLRKFFWYLGISYLPVVPVCGLSFHSVYQCLLIKYNNFNMVKLNPPLTVCIFVSCFICVCFRNLFLPPWSQKHTPIFFSKCFIVFSFISKILITFTFCKEMGTQFQSCRTIN